MADPFRRPRRSRAHRFAPVTPHYLTTRFLHSETKSESAANARRRRPRRSPPSLRTLPSCSLSSSRHALRPRPRAARRRLWLSRKNRKATYAHVLECSSKVGWGLRSAREPYGCKRAARLPKKLSRSDEQQIRLPREFLSRSGVAHRLEPSPAYARPPAQCPLASDEHVVAKRGERKSLRSPTASTRGSHGSERAPRAPRIAAELQRPLSHPARMAPARTEPDTVRVEGDPLRPLRHARPQRRIARGRGD
jgi:hypothetical protein